MVRVETTRDAILENLAALMLIAAHAVVQMGVVGLDVTASRH